jgi:NADH:ubiquinone oxidoreductase subunit 2 (subunit N)
MWALDVYEGSLILVTTFFSITPKIYIFTNMVRVFIYSFNDPTWQQLFFFVALLS